MEGFAEGFKKFMEGFEKNPVIFLLFFPLQKNPTTITK
jgi:hypothetical protein